MIEMYFRCIGNAMLLTKRNPHSSLVFADRFYCGRLLEDLPQPSINRQFKTTAIKGNTTKYL